MAYGGCMAEIDALFNKLIEEDGSDLHLCVGRPPYIRRHGDMTALDIPDNSWAGIATFYSLLHVPADEMPATLRGLQRVLRPGQRRDGWAGGGRTLEHGVDTLHRGGLGRWA